jgi:hypothetical protein
MLVYGSKMYIAMYGSKVIFVTDKSGKIIQMVEIKKDEAVLSPRALIGHKGKVYITLYEGYVAQMDTVKYESTLAKVGDNPEGLVAVENRLYVANSGGMNYPTYDNTVSVVSASDFAEISTIEVNVNPNKVESSADGDYVYVSSYGNYGDQPAKLQVITTADGRVSDLDYASVSAIAKGKDDVLYILCGGYDADWNPLPGTVYKHDMKSNKPLGAFVTDDTKLPYAYSISAAGDFVYVGCSDYKNTGDVYVFTSDGKLHDKFDSHGLNPLKAY